jgi:methionine synthase II (cobalamin-independent)
LPTPLAPVYAFVEAGSQAEVEPAYEKQLRTELDEIVAAVPADELAIQWDTAVEFGILEGMFPTGFEDAEKEIIERLLRYGSYVPAQVEMGYHLCYGDYEHKHFKEPEDASKLVKVANALAAGLDRPLNWIHLPVPRNRTDEAYFAPLKELKLKPETELYLGLVHYTDGVEGTRQRIAAAQKAVSDFGVATECGLGRRPAETIPDVMRIHAEVAEPIRAS